MALEIERKFLVHSDAWARDAARSRRLRQGYITQSDRVSIRVRIAGNSADWATFTIKTARAGIEREEYEWPIPIADAEALLGHCEGALIEKVRYDVEVGDLTWEVDVFEGNNHGLVIAEVELASADQAIAMPSWVGREVSNDRRYYNAELTRYPFSSWPADARTD